MKPFAPTLGGLQKTLACTTTALALYIEEI